MMAESADAIQYRPLPGTAPWHQKVNASSWIDPDWDIDYFVPNFGLDRDIKTSLKNVKETEAELGHKLTFSFKKPKEDPKDYYVPNFGLDEDIKNSLEITDQMEKKYGTWTP